MVTGREKCWAQTQKGKRTSLREKKKGAALTARKMAMKENLSQIISPTSEFMYKDMYRVDYVIIKNEN